MSLNPTTFYFILLKCLYQAMKLIGHVWVLWVLNLPHSTILLFDFGTVQIVWHLFVFHFITIYCHFYSRKQKGRIVSKTKLVNQLLLINSFIFKVCVCLRILKTKLTGFQYVLTSYRVLYLHDKHIKKKCCKTITMIKSVYKYWLQNKKIKKTRTMFQ